MVMLSEIPFAFVLMRCSFGPGFQIGKSVPGEDRVMINSCMLIDDDNPDMSGSELLDTLHAKRLFHIEAEWIGLLNLSRKALRAGQAHWLHRKGRSLPMRAGASRVTAAS